MARRGWLLVASAIVLSMGCEGGSESAGSCVVARKVDDCCSAPIVVSSDSLSSDPCIQLVSRFADVVACPGASRCNALTACGEIRPPSTRVGAPDDSGTCTYADECQTDADCVMATNRDACCTCPEAVPRALVEVDVCWVPAGSAAPAACDTCDDPNCQACPSAPGTAQCVDNGSGFRVCVGS